MRLLNTQTYELSGPYVPNEVPDYAILSHRWGVEEVTFKDINNTSVSQDDSPIRAKKGFAKVQGACKKAREDGYEWIWIDSCCMDKSSSAELQESINSMWRYYSESNICYVYLADIPNSDAEDGPKLTESVWFQRGWTLQELIAPPCVEFYASNWDPLGTKSQRAEEIAEVTLISIDIILRTRLLDHLCAAEKLSWAAHRKVAREEDESYSLLGLFEVNMPLLYGEGRVKAFARLQEAVFRATSDHSLFLYRHTQHTDAQPLLADSPTSFCDRDDCEACLSSGTLKIPYEFRAGDIITSDRWTTQGHEQVMTTITPLRNEMSLELPLLPYKDVYKRLTYLDDELEYEPTHVAVLSHTLQLEHHRKGALCLLIYKEKPDQDMCVRLRNPPALLPNLGNLVSKLRPTKLLFCPGPGSLGIDNRLDVSFSFKSDASSVSTWDTKGSNHKSILSKTISKDRNFSLEIIKDDKSQCGVSVSCHISSSKDPTSMLTIKLNRVYGIWSIKEVFERNKESGEQEPEALFSSEGLADRCAFEVHGMALLVKLRRLPSTARPGGEGGVAKTRYEITSQEAPYRKRDPVHRAGGLCDNPDQVPAYADARDEVFAAKPIRLHGMAFCTLEAREIAHRCEEDIAKFNDNIAFLTSRISLLEEANSHLQAQSSQWEKHDLQIRQANLAQQEQIWEQWRDRESMEYWLRAVVAKCLLLHEWKLHAIKRFKDKVMLTQSESQGHIDAVKEYE